MLIREILAERLLRVLEAGRGRQSVTLIVYGDRPYPFVDLRVDEHADSVAELRRVYGIAERRLLPFVKDFPTRENPRATSPRS